MSFNIKILKHRLKNVSLTIQKEIVSEALTFLPDTSFVTDKEAGERIDICEDCEELDISSRKCNICTCFVDLKTKVKQLPFLAPENCPLKKW